MSEHPDIHVDMTKGDKREIRKFLRYVHKVETEKKAPWLAYAEVYGEVVYDADRPERRKDRKE